MFKSLKNNNAGFSIVEIMIVLVVVGLVTTGVILAAQTLNRNARNDARDRDVQLIASGISDYQQANNGSLNGVQNGITNGSNFVGTLELSHYDGENTLTNFETTTPDTLLSNQSYVVIRGQTNGVVNNLDQLPNEDNVHILVGYSCPEQLNLLNNGAYVDGDTNRNGVWNTGETWKAVTVAENVSSGTDGVRPPVPASGWEVLTTGGANIYGSFRQVTNRAFAVVSRHEGGGDVSYRCVDFGS